MNDVGIAYQEHETGTKQVSVLLFAHAQSRTVSARVSDTLARSTVHSNTVKTVLTLAA